MRLHLAQFFGREPATWSHAPWFAALLVSLPGISRISGRRVQPIIVASGKEGFEGQAKTRFHASSVSNRRLIETDARHLAGQNAPFADEVEERVIFVGADSPGGDSGLSQRAPEEPG